MIPAPPANISIVCKGDVPHRWLCYLVTGPNAGIPRSGIHTFFHFHAEFLYTMKILMGIGNELRRDDGVGMYVARKFREEGWQTLECATVPENFTGIVRRARPELLLIVDAADMGLEPGVVRIIPPEKIRDVGIGTHQISIEHLIRFLQDDAGKIVFIGIQPADTGDGEGISAGVLAGAEWLMQAVRDSAILKIPCY